MDISTSIGWISAWDGDCFVCSKAVSTLEVLMSASEVTDIYQILSDHHELKNPTYFIPMDEQKQKGRGPKRAINLISKETKSHLS